jgi:4'-phosphopantetheinyl transferase
VGAVEVWWARLRDCRPELAHDLDAVERERLAAYARDEDRARFVLGCAIVRRVLGDRLGVPARAVVIDRTCGDCGRPHGKVRADGTQLSVSHSGDLVGVALHPSTPVGLDVEVVDPLLDASALAPVALADSETKELARYDGTARARAFTTYWTRKEAVVKATGEGIRADFRQLVVTPPDHPAGVVEWAGHEGPVQLADLDGDSRHVAALAVLTDEVFLVQSLDAAPLLSA